MKGGWLKYALVGVPVLVTVLALAGQLLIEREAQKNEAELERCLDGEDESERCRVMKCLAMAKGQARADCIAGRGAEAKGEGPASKPSE